MARGKKEVTPTEPDLSGVTIQQLEAKIQQLYHEEMEVEEAQAELDRRKSVAENTKAWLCAFMKEHRKTSYPSSWGTLVKRVRSTYSVPKDTHSREKFFDYLKSKGVFDNLITVHSATLNSFVNAEADAAAARGEFEYTVPGLGQPTVFESVSLTRKGRKGNDE